MLDEETVLQVNKELELEGVSAKYVHDDDGPEMWTVQLPEPNQTTPAFLFLSEANDYFVCFAPIPGLKRSLENLKNEQLRSLIKLNGSVRLAKLEYQEDGGRALYYAVSECAVDGFTGAKLRKRLEACVALARAVSAKVK